MSTNQCDGCRTGAPLRDGLHTDKDGRAFMSCQVGLYATEPQEPGFCNHCSAVVARWAIGERGGICPVCGNQWIERMEPAPAAKAKP